MPIHDWPRVIPGIFHDFHHEWISTIKRALNSGLLPPDYYALAEQIAGGLGPDVLALESNRPRTPAANGNGSGSDAEPVSGGVALATAPPRVRFTSTVETEKYARKRKRIAVRHASDDRVVAMIELVSPGNKGSRYALRSFVEKALQLLDAGVHLLIVDLFPPGPRDPQGIHGAIWSEMIEEEFRLPADQPLTLASYAAADVTQAFVETAAVGGALPEMPLFLRPRFYVPVPLEATYQAAFEAVPKRWQEELGSPTDQGSR